MAWQIKAPVSKADDLKSIPWDHIIQGKNQFLQVVLITYVLHSGPSVCVPEHTHTR